MSSSLPLRLLPEEDTQKEERKGETCVCTFCVCTRLPLKKVSSFGQMERLLKEEGSERSLLRVTRSQRERLVCVRLVCVRLLCVRDFL